MRVPRSVQVLTLLTSLATLAGCSSYGGHARSEPDPSYSTTVVAWDSGPLDQDYHRQRSEMDARHSQEVANPRADESSDQRVQRHAHENDDLAQRYAQGKAAHAQTVPDHHE